MWHTSPVTPRARLCSLTRIRARAGMSYDGADNPAHRWVHANCRSHSFHCRAALGSCCQWLFSSRSAQLDQGAECWRVPARLVCEHSHSTRLQPPLRFPHIPHACRRLTSRIPLGQAAGRRLKGRPRRMPPGADGQSADGSTLRLERRMVVGSVRPRPVARGAPREAGKRRVRHAERRCRLMCEAGAGAPDPHESCCECRRECRRECCHGGL